ncbi:MAG TPA: hypothetical protein VKV24_09075 [Casimicrobiaceae bacterium]|nr:hypothetical protein [Casimicrobiaceae bacterium]
MRCTSHAHPYAHGRLGWVDSRQPRRRASGTGKRGRAIGDSSYGTNFRTPSSTSSTPFLQKGEDDAALTQVDRLRNTPSIEPSFKTAFHLASTQARYALERREWGRSAALVPRMPASLDWDRFSWPEAITRFARGLGAAHLQHVNEATQEIRKLEELEVATRKAGERPVRSQRPGAAPSS